LAQLLPFPLAQLSRRPKSSNSLQRRIHRLLLLLLLLLALLLQVLPARFLPLRSTSVVLVVELRPSAELPRILSRALLNIALAGRGPDRTHTWLRRREESARHRCLVSKHWRLRKISI
jgi:hypothetical protein